MNTADLGRFLMRTSSGAYRTGVYAKLSNESLANEEYPRESVESIVKMNGKPSPLTFHPQLKALTQKAE